MKRRIHILKRKNKQNQTYDAAVIGCRQTSRFVVKLFTNSHRPELEEFLSMVYRSARFLDLCYFSSTLER